MTINLNAQSLTTSWKTTLVGIISLFVAAMQTYNLGWAMAIHDPRVQLAVVVGLLGLIAKDGNVTGGTKGQPSTPAALAAANQAPAVGADAPKA